MGMDYSPEALRARFSAKVQHDPETGCEVWTGARERDGHGRFRIAWDAVVRVHRWAWEQERGPIPEGKILCHTCDVPACVNLAHLYIGDHADNVRDREARGRGVRRTGAQAGGPRLRMYQ